MFDANFCFKSSKPYPASLSKCVVFVIRLISFPPIMINPDVLVGMKQYYAKVANPEKSEKRENLEYF